MGRLVLALALAALLGAPVMAADNPQFISAAEMKNVRGMIEAKDFKGAIKELNRLVEFGIVDADVYNLLGFSLRKDGDLDRAGVFYDRALKMNPNHLGALEYQGELFLQRGDRPAAEQNLARLRALCPSGCEELQDLEAAIKAAETKG